MYYTVRKYETEINIKKGRVELEMKKKEGKKGGEERDGEERVFHFFSLFDILKC